jgi:putative hydrolases of HD superfamily
MDMNLANSVDFIFELNQLKREPHRGITLAGVSSPASVAEHVMHTAQIGLILAEMERVDPAKVMMMCLLHDNAKTRIGDHHKVAARYVDKKEGEIKAP